MRKSFSFFNIISFDSDTLCTTLFQFFYPLGKVGSFKAFEILIHSSNNFRVRQKCALNLDIPFTVLCANDLEESQNITL